MCQCGRGDDGEGAVTSGHSMPVSIASISMASLSDAKTMRTPDAIATVN